MTYAESRRHIDAAEMAYATRYYAVERHTYIYVAARLMPLMRYAKVECGAALPHEKATRQPLYFVTLIH